MFVIYCDVDIRKLIPGVNRPQQWIDEHPKFRKMQDLLIEDIIINGLKHPLTCANVKDDGTYQVTVGNQRLSALKKLRYKTVKCLISFDENDKYILDGIRIDDPSGLLPYFQGICNIIWNKNTFSVYPKDTSQYDPNIVF